MTRTNHFFKSFFVIIFFVVITFTMTESAEANVFCDFDWYLNNGADLDVDNIFGEDVADLTIEPDGYEGYAGLFAFVVPDPHPELEGECANFWWSLHTQGTENWEGTLVLYYDESDLNGIAESDLALNHFDGEEWVELETVVDEEENTVTAVVHRDDFSPYALSARQTPGTTGGDEFGEKQLEDNTINSMKRPITMSNYPNPFNPQTTIEFTLPEASANVNLAIYDLSGKMVKSFIDNEQRSQGTYSMVWDGTDQRGATVSSGVYLYVLRTETKMLTRRMTLLK